VGETLPASSPSRGLPSLEFGLCNGLQGRKLRAFAFFPVRPEIARLDISFDYTFAGMASTATTYPSNPSVLFRSDDSSVILVDIPRSLEQSQVGPREVPTRRIVSAQPASTPFLIPEPTLGDGGSRSQAAQVADLMTQAVVMNAIDILNHSYDGSLCLPRMIAPAASAESRPDLLMLPKDAHYIDGSLQDTKLELTKAASTFDLVVMDPPWPNRSARRRSSRYDTVKDLHEMQGLLSHVPVGTHLSDEGIVAVWVTNKQSVSDFVKSPTGLFASWGLSLVSEWTWLKVTESGETIFPLDSAWRKPWEKLLIGKRLGRAAPPALAKSRVIIAVPDVHSRKPNLRDVFAEFLGCDYNGLEVFARNVTVGWWSWGNEVLHFQAAQHWVPE
jgi:N6-adenosine-specific RNA methylase IME4